MFTQRRLELSLMGSSNGFVSNVVGTMIPSTLFHFGLMTLNCYGSLIALYTCCVCVCGFTQYFVDNQCYRKRTFVPFFSNFVFQVNHEMGNSRVFQLINPRKQCLAKITILTRTTFPAHCSCQTNTRRFKLLQTGLERFDIAGNNCLLALNASYSVCLGY